jgi:hypothetical protein
MIDIYRYTSYRDIEGIEMTEKYEFENVICENINELKNELYNYLNCVITDDEIEDLINETENTICIGNITFNPGYVLRELDPIAFDLIKDDEITYSLDDFIYEIKNNRGTTKTKFVVPYSTDCVNVIVIEED